MNTQELLDEIHDEFEWHEAKIDRQIQDQLQLQRNKAYKLINETVAVIHAKKKYVHYPTEKLQKCEEMRRYVEKWGYMPDSYKRMCRRWKEGKEMYFKEWEKMIGWVEKKDRSSTYGSEVPTMLKEHGGKMLE